MKSAHNNGHHHSDGELATLKAEVASLKDDLSENVGNLAEHGSRIARSAGAAAKSAVVSAGRQGSDLAQQAAKTTRKAVAQRPLTSIALAALTGAVLTGGFLMMRSKSRGA